MFMALAFVTTLSAQQLEKLFDKYMEDERFNYVYQKKASMMDKFADLGNMETWGTDKSLDESFTQEVKNALQADKYEEVSIVRNGKNRVETYERKSDKGLSKVSFIKNPGSIMVSLNTYAPGK